MSLKISFAHAGAYGVVTNRRGWVILPLTEMVMVSSYLRPRE